MCEKQICRSFLKLQIRWRNEWSKNRALATGGEGTFDTDRFAALIRDTGQACKDFVQFQDQIKDDKTSLSEVRNAFRRLLEEGVFHYRCNSFREDKSADRVFTASQAVIDLLFRYYPYDGPVLRGHIKDFDMPLRSDVDLESLRERVFSYDTNTGDMTEMIEFAQLVGDYEEPDDLPF